MKYRIRSQVTVNGETLWIAAGKCFRTCKAFRAYLEREFPNASKIHVYRDLA